MVHPIQRVSVDVTASMLEKLDKAARDLNGSRQAVIKTLVRQALDPHLPGTTRKATTAVIMTATGTRTLKGRTARNRRST